MEQWQITGSELLKCNVTWVIENALYQLSTGKPIRSSDFEFEQFGKWGLDMQFRQRTEDIRVKLFWKRREVAVYAECNVSILDRNGLKTETIHMPMLSFFGAQYNHDFAETFKMHDLRSKPELLPEGKLTLLYTVSILVESNNTCGEGKIMNKPRVVIPDCNLTDQLGTLLQDDKYSDIVVAVGGQEMKAHKKILAVRSPVFAAMLDSQMKETQQNRLVITDCDYDVMKEMLHYIYTGKAPNVTKMAERLLMAAAKYALDRLKVMCEQVLSETLSVETAMNLLAVAETYNAVQLKAITYDYIMENFQKLIKLEDCKDLIKKQAMQLYSNKRKYSNIS